MNVGTQERSLDVISCCQGLASCNKPVEHWLQKEGLVFCRHSSSGIFGAIREDNRDLFHYYLTSLTRRQLIQQYNRETCFGDTLLIFAASLGRVDIARSLLNSIVDILNSVEGKDLLLSDFVDFESSRGKIAIVEAIRGNHLEMVDLLLSFHAQTAEPSNRHKKSALEWAKVYGHVNLVNSISEHHQISNHVKELFTAILKHDIDAVRKLTEGGAPYEWNQDKTFCQELENKIKSVSTAKQSVKELDEELSKVDRSLSALTDEIRNRGENIEKLRAEQQEITSTRISATMQALAKVRLAATPNNILALLNIENPSAPDVLVAKGVCTLLHLKKQNGNSAEANDALHSGDYFYWQHFKEIVKDSSSFYHRLRHFFHNTETVALAANAKIHGLSSTCLECIKSKGNGNKDDNTTSSVLLNAIKEWLHVIFQSSEGHLQENKLIQTESEERSMLERNKIDEEVLTSSICILRREIDELNSSITFGSGTITQLQRKIQLSKVMKFVTANGHSVLSWAMSAGNEAIVKRLLLNGAHTSIGEEVVALCAVIIQICFRRYLTQKSFSKLPPKRINRERCFEHRSRCLTMTMRITSLHRLFRRRLLGIRLPLAEALINGHSQLIKVLRESKNPAQLKLFQAVNLAPSFHPPQCCLPRILPGNEIPQISDANLASICMSSVQFQHENDPKSCKYVESYKCTVKLVNEHMLRRREALEAKIKARRATLLQRHRKLKVAELISAMREGDFINIFRISIEGGISLDYEDSDTGMTPLIIAASRDESIEQKQELVLNKKRVSAVVYLLDRINPYKPSIGFESRLGRTALAAACANGRLQAVNELLSRGARINQQSMLMGQTALMCASLVGKFDVVKLLLSHGANIHLQDHSGSTAYDLAVQNKHTDISEHLGQLKKS